MLFKIISNNKVHVLVILNIYIFAFVKSAIYG